MDQILELLGITLDEFGALKNLRELEQFDSITHMNLVLLIEANLNKTLNADEMGEILDPMYLRTIL